jgi:hypothetical protein
MRFVLACTIVLTMVAMAAAQTPQPVVRMGDWVEVGNEAFMNIIATVGVYYNISHNLDFENDVEDRALSRNPASTALQSQSSDAMWQETRFGVDFRYQKNMKMRVLFENQTIIDGNLIDDRTNSSNPGGTDVFGRAAGGEGESTNLERFWIEYSFPGTPLRMRVGADLWAADQARLLGDDDPRLAFYLDLGPKKELELGFWAAVQTEASRRGRVNDNDDIYYVFHLRYKGMKPHALGVDVAYFRFRALGSSASGDGQKIDSVLVMPSWSGAFGPISGMLQFNAVFGTQDSTNATGNIEYDIFGWAIVAAVEVNLGVVRPFISVVYGSADDDPNDTDLGGFHTLPQGEITLLSGNRFFNHLDVAKAFGSRDVIPPARAGFDLGGTEWGHSVGNPFNNRIGNNQHNGLTGAAYSNPGVLMIPVGVKIFPLKGHSIDLFYIYKAMVDTALVENAIGGGVSISKTMYHDIGVTWEWTLSSHFDIRVNGQIILPGDGAKDIARQVTCPDGTPCQGEDPALTGEVRFRGRF